MRPTATPPWRWDTGPCPHVDFISDLHLQASHPHTASAFFDFLDQRPAAPLVVLGDLFEVWIGDDCLLSPGFDFERQCVDALKRVSGHSAVAWVCGNRDFLVGEGFHQAVGWAALNDPCVVHAPFGSCLISHGDAWCVDDADYMAFRQQTRQAQWCQQFLAQPLSSRAQQARRMREQSQHNQSAKTKWADVDLSLARSQLAAHGCHHLVHGHTHHPGDEDLGQGMHRHVLSDWELDAPGPARAQVLRWSARGFERLDVKA